ncbi:MAG: UvrB/UvrC motif-containing protein [bacterium]|nr:UvrB/UvrC motif-containing protein [bacterium]
MNILDIEKLEIPSDSGVYFFKNKSEILYIGRATNLRDRVKSYFKDDLIATRGPLLVDMISKSNYLEWEVADSVLEAIILENKLIKELQPRFNTKEKDDKSYNYIVITKEEWPKVMVVRGRELEKDSKYRKTFGPYINSGLLREALKIIRKIFPFIDDKSSKKYSELFYRNLGLSPSVDGVNSHEEYLKNIKYISDFLDGKKKQILLSLEKDMNICAKNQEFEKAGQIRNKIKALNHIHDIALIKKEHEEERKSNEERKNNELSKEGANKEIFRIEAYDISHLSGFDAVGSMVVMENGELNKAEYRKFKIKSGEGNNDSLNTEEIIRRRIAHNEWRIPDLIVLDGSNIEINSAKRAIEKAVGNSVIWRKIPIVSVLKDSRHKAKEIRGEEKALKITEKMKDEILLLNSEAHRFAIFYQKNIRKNKFIYE